MASIGIGVQPCCCPSGFNPNCGGQPVCIAGSISENLLLELATEPWGTTGPPLTENPSCTSEFSGTSHELTFIGTDPEYTFSGSPLAVRDSDSNYVTDSCITIPQSFPSRPKTILGVWQGSPLGITISPCTFDRFYFHGICVDASTPDEEGIFAFQWVATLNYESSFFPGFPLFVAWTSDPIYISSNNLDCNNFNFPLPYCTNSAIHCCVPLGDILSPVHSPFDANISEA